MRFKITAALLFWLCAPALAGSPYALPYFQTVPGTERLANGVMTIVSQDTRGLIWIGTTEGVVSYDGYQLRRYRHDPDDERSLGDDYVRALMPHSDGRMWVATQAAGLSIYDPATDDFERVEVGEGPCDLPSQATVAMAEEPGGAVWVGLGNVGAARWDRDSRCFEHFPPDPGDATAIAHDTVRALLFDENGDLWLGTGNGLQRRRAGSTAFERVRSAEDDADGFHRQYVYGLLQGSDGRLWIGTQSDGAAVYDPGTDALIRFPVGEQGVSHPWISGFVEARPDEIWVYTFGGGIDVIDAAANRIAKRIGSDLSIPGGLALDRLVAPFKDASGVIWIGTWGSGLQRHNPINSRAFSTLRDSAAQPDGLRSADVHSTLPEGPRRLWVGSSSGLDLFDLDQGLLRSYRPNPEQAHSLADGTIRALARTTDGTMWVGTQQSGLQRYRKDSDDFSIPVQSLRRGPVRRLLAASDGSLWVGIQAGLARIASAESEAISLRLAGDERFTDAIWSLVEDRQGRIWASTPNTLLLWRRERGYLETIDSPDAPLRAVTNLLVDANGTLWCSGPRGIARLVGWDGDLPLFEDYGRKLGALPPGLGQQLLDDGEGRLWGPTGIIDVGTDSLDEISVADGVDIGSVSDGSSSRLESGLLVFGGTRGLLIIEPQRYTRWQFQPPLLVTELEIGGKPKPIGDLRNGITLMPEQRRVSVGFAGLDYSAPEELGYAYRLVGLDTDWTEVGADRRLASYNNLWPRDYQLQLKVRSRQGQWSEPLSIPVRVQPAFWQTPLAYAMAVIILLAMTYALVRWRTHRINQRALGLQDLVARRTAELQGAKDRAESALGELQGTQRQLVVAEKMASLGQLVAGVAHEINTPIGIAVTAASHLDEVSRKSAAKLREGALTRTALETWKSEVEEGTKLILRSLDRAAALVASFKQVSVDQSSDQRRSFDLAGYLEEVRLALRPMIRRSKHQFSIDCPTGIDVDTYPGALFQILTNLLANAINHAFDGVEQGHAELRISVAGNDVLLQFSDDGKGMSDEVLQRAFDPFFTTRRASGGSGLGLHIVHNLVTQLLGGEIELESAPDRGTQFKIRVPKVAPKSTS